MDRRHGHKPAALLLGLVLGATPAAHASLLIDLDGSRSLWRNDGDPRVVVRKGGVSRSLASQEVLASPLTAGGALRLPRCRALPDEHRGPCDDSLQPPGPLQLELELPLDPALRDAYLKLWEKTAPAVPPEQESLAEAMQTLAHRLALPIQQRELAQLLTPLREASRAAEEAGVAPVMVATARRGERMLDVFGDLWQLRNTLSSRDLNLPCDSLEAKAGMFNQVAGSSAVQLQRQQPAGICLFCENVCTLRSADRLLGAMKAAVIEVLREGGEPAGPQPGAHSTREVTPPGRSRPSPR